MGVFGVSNFTVTKIFPRLTLIAMVTNISEVEHKVAKYMVRRREKSNILHPTGDIQCG